MLSVHNYSNVMLTWGLPLNVLISVGILAYCFMNEKKFNKEVANGWKSTVIVCLILNIISWLVVWITSLEIFAFLISLLCLIISTLFALDLLRQLTNETISPWFNRALEVNLSLSVLLAIGDILFVFTAIAILYD